MPKNRLKTGDVTSQSRTYRIGFFPNENISCHINKQEMSQPLATSGLQMLSEDSQNCDPGDAATPCMVIAEELGECKKQPSAAP